MPQPDENRTRRSRWLLRIIGYGFLVLGVAGLFLPVLQGVLFLLIGLVVLAVEEAWARHLLERIARRFPHLAERLRQARARAQDWIQAKRKR